MVLTMDRELDRLTAEAAHDIGLAAILGGNLFARIGMHPALREVSDERERGRVVNAAWRRYGTVNSLGLAALVAGWAGGRAARPDRSPRDRALASADDVATAVVAVTGVVAGVQGIRFARMEPAGAVPLEDGSEAAPAASVGEARAKRALNAVGVLHLSAALTLALVTAARRQQPPQVRRRLRRR
jgi:hypothetical protein